MRLSVQNNTHLFLRLRHFAIAVMIEKNPGYAIDQSAPMRSVKCLYTLEGIQDIPSFGSCVEHFLELPALFGFLTAQKG